MVKLLLASLFLGLGLGFIFGNIPGYTLTLLGLALVASALKTKPLQRIRRPHIALLTLAGISLLSLGLIFFISFERALIAWKYLVGSTLIFLALSIAVKR